MTDDALADIILRGLYNSQTVTRRDDPEEIALAHGVDDRIQIDRVCDDLHSMDLITDYINHENIIAKITGKGARAIQAIDNESSVMAYLHRQASPTIGGVHVYGAVSNANIASHSPHVNQSIIINPDINEALQKM